MFLDTKEKPTGSIIGLTVSIVAKNLNITTSMATEAMESGCENYEQITEYFKL